MIFASPCKQTTYVLFSCEILFRLYESVLRGRPLRTERKTASGWSRPQADVRVGGDTMLFLRSCASHTLPPLGGAGSSHNACYPAWRTGGSAPRVVSWGRASGG